jgi:hypothetical protein
MALKKKSKNPKKKLTENYEKIPSSSISPFRTQKIKILIRKGRNH